MAKITIRLHERDDKDLLDILKDRNASRVFRDALRAQIQKDRGLEEQVRQYVARCLFDLLTGASRLSDLVGFLSDRERTSPTCGDVTPMDAGPELPKAEARRGGRAKEQPRHRPEQTSSQKQGQPELFQDPPGVGEGSSQEVIPSGPDEKSAPGAASGDAKSSALDRPGRSAFAMAGLPIPPDGNPTVPP